MSAFGGKADISDGEASGPLLTQSGHFSVAAEDKNQLSVAAEDKKSAANLVFWAHRGRECLALWVALS